MFLIDSKIDSSSFSSVESTIYKTKSHSSIAFLDLIIPWFSIISSDSLIPAVSLKNKVTPLIIIEPSTISLVVPGIAVTIALSSFNNAFNKDDLPAFGLPTIAILTPSLIIFPL